MSATTAVRPRSPDSIAARRTSGGGHRRGAGDGVAHEAGQRALAQLADQQAPQEVDLGRRGPIEQRRAGSPRRPAAEPLPGRHQDLVEGAVDVGDRQRRHRRRRHVEPEHAWPSPRRSGPGAPRR